MNSYTTGTMIRRLREEKNLTQADLAEKLFVSDKAISKWETGKGYPDITLIEPLAAALGVSVPELLSGENICNSNRAGNMQRTVFYVCPLCGNIITAVGECVVSCCGITLFPQEAEVPDEAHALRVEPVEDELYITLSHEMTKSHFISFIAVLTFDGLKLCKLYPEGNAEVRFKSRGVRAIYWYCNHHGLFMQRWTRKKG